MSALPTIEQSIESLLRAPLYGLPPEQHQQRLLELLKREVAYACERNPQYRNYVEQWPRDLQTADAVMHLPYLPVGVFKANPPLALVPTEEVKRTLTSSSTSGQTPSRIVLDAATSRRMTKGVVSIVRDFIGSSRRPYLVIDTPENLAWQTELGARGAAIQGLGSFGTEVVACLQRAPAEESTVDLDKLLACTEKWKEIDVLVYGFTYVIWTSLVEPLQRRGIKLNMPKVHVLHSGGWKKLEERAVSKNVFIRGVSSIFGCSAERVIDYYGMVENVGVVYPDCERGNKHVPAFADVIVRNPLTLAAVEPGQEGLVQVCSVLPTSFPGFLVLTDDFANLIGCDGCTCGRRGTYFRFARRVPKVEVRGCGNLESKRSVDAREAVSHG